MKIILILLATTFGILSCTTRSKSQIPSLTAKLYRSDSINLQQSAEDKVLVLHTWSIFCGPCLAELRSIHNLYGRYKTNKKVKFLTIALNTESELDKFNADPDTTTFYHWSFKASKLDSFYIPTLIGAEKGYKIQKLNDSYSAYLENDEKTEYLYKAFKFNSIPLTLIFNKAGKIAMRHDGSETSQEGLAKQEKKYQQVIDSLLAQ